MVQHQEQKSNPFSTPIVDTTPRLVGAQPTDDGGHTNVNGWQYRAERLERENTDLRERAGESASSLIQELTETRAQVQRLTDELEEAYKAVSVGSRMRLAAERERDELKHQYKDALHLVEQWRQEATERQKEAIHLGADRQLIYALLAEFVDGEPSEAFREQSSAIVAAWRAQA